MAGSYDTFTKLENLLRTTSLTPTKFSALCRWYEVKGMSDASLNRALQRKSFSHEVDLAIRPIILEIEDLIERAKPFSISFDDIEGVYLMLFIKNYVNVQIELPKETK
jgi:hypothetical protein